MPPASHSPYTAAIEAGGRATYIPLGSILQGLADEFSFALSSDWDGLGARAVSTDVLKLADRILAKYATGLNLVEASPSRKGSLSFVWENGQGDYAYLDIGPNNTVHLFYNTRTGRKWEGVALANDPRLNEQLERAFSAFRPGTRAAAEIVVLEGNVRSRRWLVTVQPSSGNRPRLLVAAHS